MAAAGNAPPDDDAAAHEAAVGVALARRWLDTIAREVAARADELTRLDSDIGDADHGVNLTCYQGLQCVSIFLIVATNSFVLSGLIKIGSRS